jgi:hypothetical protein
MEERKTIFIHLLILPPSGKCKKALTSSPGCGPVASSLYIMIASIYSCCCWGGAAAEAEAEEEEPEAEAAAVGEGGEGSTGMCTTL